MVVHLIHGWDVAEWIERLTANAEVATVLGSIPASSDTVESEGRQMKLCLIKYIHKKSPCLIMVVWWGLCPSACWWASCETPPTWWPRPCRGPPPPASPATSIATGGHQKRIKIFLNRRKFRRDRLHIQFDQGPPHIWPNIWPFHHKLGSPSSYMTLQPILSEFPCIWGKFYFFFISV